jgi:hypothetical protein
MTDSLPAYFRDSILPLCQTPLIAGLLIHLVLMAPLSQYDIDTTLTESYIKEIAVMESSKRPHELDFSVYFGNYHSQVHPSVAPNPGVARFVHKLIDRWIGSLQERVLLPRITSKTVSKNTAYTLRSTLLDYEPNDPMGVTPIDLERVYYLHGWKVPGSCEMRQKWYVSNLKPRTYYATGGDAYHTSKYLSRPFTELCDLLPATNRRLRVNPSRIHIADDALDIAYYDLSSFSSNLHEHDNFMGELATYCMGTTVELLDSVHGIMEHDLGALIRDYNATNLHYPAYTAPARYGDPTVDRYQGIAGFLGVFGNIATATFIHGIVMAMRHTRFDENNVAGDDGLDVTDSVEDTLALVRTLGTVSDEKTFRDHEGGCIHLKRPILRYGGRLFHGNLVAWPSLEPVMTTIDARYPYLRSNSQKEKIDALAGSVTAFLRKLESLVLSDADVDLVDTFLSHVYNAYALPKEGYVPQCTLQSHFGFIPTYERRFIGVDPIWNTLCRHYTGTVEVRLRGCVQWDVGQLQEGTFRCNSNGVLRHLVCLGVMEQNKLSVEAYGEDGLQRLLKEYMDPDPPIYEYVCSSKIPAWITEVSCRKY